MSRQPSCYDGPVSEDEHDRQVAGGVSRRPSPSTTHDRHPPAPAPDDPRLDAWRAFLYAQSTLMPRLDAELRAETGLTLAEFDALAQLSFSRRRRLRMSDLADRVLLSRSGVTRMVDRLERDGYVTREACAPDGRGSYACLTPAGLERLREAMPVHLAAVGAHFMEHVEAADARSLTRALGAVAEANGRRPPSSQASAAALGRLAEASETSEPA